MSGAQEQLRKEEEEILKSWTPEKLLQRQEALLQIWGYAPPRKNFANWWSSISDKHGKRFQNTCKASFQGLWKAGGYGDDPEEYNNVSFVKIDLACPLKKRNTPKP